MGSVESDLADELRDDIDKMMVCARRNISAAYGTGQKPDGENILGE